MTWYGIVVYCAVAACDVMACGRAVAACGTVALCGIVTRGNCAPKKAHIAVLKLRSQLRKCMAVFPIYLRKQQRHTASCLNCFRSSNNSNIPKALTLRSVKHPRAHCQRRVGRIEHKHVCFLFRHYLSYSKGIVANASCTGTACTYLHLSIGACAHNKRFSYDALTCTFYSVITFSA